jgi:Fanconi anemia group M protein
VYITKDNIKPDTIEWRAYQENIANAAIKANTLVVLPTGLGKTIIALVVIAEQLKKQGNKMLFLAPTKPLVLQHARFLKEFLTFDETQIAVFTGEISPAKRKQLWEDNRIIVSTPQVIENDLVSRQISLDKVSFIIFDEVHRTVGNYSYVYVAEMYQQQATDRLILGMTASPGNDLQQILEVCKHLDIKNIEIRTKNDPDVRPYVHELTMQWKEITLPAQFSQVVQLFRKALQTRLTQLKDLGVLDTTSVSLINRTKLLEVQNVIQQALRSQANPPKELYTAASTQNAALKLYHGIELLQTQGVSIVKNYFQRMEHESTAKGGSKASRDIMRDPVVLDGLAYLKSLEVEHPKIAEITKIVSEQLRQNKDSKIIVFTHYRDTSNHILQQLEHIDNVRPVRFIGQAGRENDKGLSQKEQAAIIQQFTDGEFNVLIATSVAEEGLDIPSTDLVVFYEPIPSEIRTIQRRGRTGRKMPGKVIILITKNTPDEAYYWSARRKEKQMHSELEYIRSSLKREVQDAGTLYQRMTVEKDDQKKLEDYQPGEQLIEVIVDTRESRSNVARFLSHRQDVKISSQQLDIGDYVLSSRIGVERKTVEDFLGSLLEGKLFQQMRNLRGAYSRPVLIVEGEGLLTKRNISHQAIFGCFVSIIVDFGIPIIETRNPGETADFLYVMASREQREGKRAVAIRGEKYAMSLPEHQRFIVEGLPNISVVLAKRLLQHFGSIHAVVNASEEELSEVQGIGKTIAADIVKVLRSEYTENK